MGIGMVQSGYGVFLNKQTTEVERKRKNAYGTERSRDEKDKTAECMEFLRGKSEEILEKLRTGETEVSYPIGAEFYTEKEWDKLLKKFDDIQEDVRQKMEERFRKLEEKEEEKRVAEGWNRRISHRHELSMKRRRSIGAVGFWHITSGIPGSPFGISGISFPWMNY